MTRGKGLSNIVRIQLEVPDLQRDKWDKYVEESGEVSTRPDLICTAVEQYIETDNNSGSGTLNDAVVADPFDKVEMINERTTELETIVKGQRRENITEDRKVYCVPYR